MTRREQFSSSSESSDDIEITFIFTRSPSRFQKSARPTPENNLASVERTGRLLPQFKGAFYAAASPKEREQFDALWPNVCDVVNTATVPKELLVPFLRELLTETPDNLLLGNPSNGTFPRPFDYFYALHKLESAVFKTAADRIDLFLTLLAQRFCKGVVIDSCAVSHYYKTLGQRLGYSSQRLEAAFVADRQACRNLVKRLRRYDCDYKAWFQNDLNHLAPLGSFNDEERTPS